jgi:hypothetical protein
MVHDHDLASLQQQITHLRHGLQELVEVLRAFGSDLMPDTTSTESWHTHLDNVAELLDPIR